jgi:hypothetical protein
MHMPPSPLLEKWQRNELLKAIQAGELDPREFALENSAEARVKRKWSRSFFMISYDAGCFIEGSMLYGMAWTGLTGN